MKTHEEIIDEIFGDLKEKIQFEKDTAKEQLKCQEKDILEKIEGLDDMFLNKASMSYSSKGDLWTILKQDWNKIIEELTNQIKNNSQGQESSVGSATRGSAEFNPDTSQICECGETKENHLKGRTNKYGECMKQGCLCKKFTPQIKSQQDKTSRSILRGDANTETKGDKTADTSQIKSEGKE